MKQKAKIVLGIETSCDDTSVAILQKDSQSPLLKVLSHLSYSQEETLREWGGVVPEIAARNHLAKILPLLKASIKKAQIEMGQVELIGVTTHPGLLGPLLTGLNSAKTLALYHEVPIAPVNHLYAHLEAIHLTEEMSYPYLGLVVSGGHSLFMLVEGPTSFKLIGTTRDDAAGEAFDKGGKLLGLGYPAGRIIDNLAKKGNPDRFEFPIGLRSLKTPEMSFSGVKTGLRYLLEKNPNLLNHGFEEGVCDGNQALWDLCASYQKAIVMALTIKAKEAIKSLPPHVSPNIPLVIGGGVACNSELRRVFNLEFDNTYFVAPKFCTDNGAMIANLAFRTQEEMAVPFPKCLELDARGRFIKKGPQKRKRPAEVTAP